MLAVVPCAAMAESGSPRCPSCGYVYPSYGCFGYPGPPQIIQAPGNEVRKVLDAISNPADRQKFAVAWLKFSEQSATKSLQIQKEWVELQKSHLTSQVQIEQHRLEKLKLEVEIEKLQVEKLRLEKENLQLRLKLQSQNSKKEKAEGNVKTLK
jgi:hypothetical protein